MSLWDRVSDKPVSVFRCFPRHWPMIGQLHVRGNVAFLFRLAFTRRPAFGGGLVRQDTKRKFDIVHFKRLLAQALGPGFQRPVTMYVYINMKGRIYIPYVIPFIWRPW